MKQKILKTGTEIVDTACDNVNYLQGDFRKFKKINEREQILWNDTQYCLEHFEIDEGHPLQAVHGLFLQNMKNWLQDTFACCPSNPQEGVKILENSGETLRALKSCLTVQSDIPAKIDRPVPRYEWVKMHEKHLRKPNIAEIDEKVYGKSALSEESLRSILKTPNKNIDGQIVVREDGYSVGYYIAHVTQENIRVLHAAFRPPYHVHGAREEMAADLLHVSIDTDENRPLIISMDEKRKVPKP